MAGREGARAAALAELGYDPKWWQYGFVDEPFLVSQLARYRSGEDPHGEHHRYAAFMRILTARAVVDDVTLSRYIELAELDRDRTMAEAALIRLIAWPGLTDEQRAGLRGQPAFAAPAVQRALSRRLSSGAGGS
jgi:hypothetical protein